MSILTCRTTTFCLRSLLLLLVLIGLTIIAVRSYLLPSMQQYRGELEQIVEQEVGLPIKIGSISAGLWGTHLEIVLKQIELIDPKSGNSQLKARELHAQINLIESLMERRLKLGKIMLVGTRLELLMRRDGTVVLEGFDSNGPSAGESGAGGLLFQESELLLHESEVYWKNQRLNAPPLYFSDVDVALVNRNGKHWLKAGAQLGWQAQSRIELRAELTGDLTEPGDWRGEVYFQGEQLALDQLLSARRPEGTQIDQGTLDTKIWARWSNSRLIHVQGDVDIKALQLTTTHDKQVRHTSLDRLKSGISWQVGAGGWQLSLPALSVTKGGVVWPQSGVVVDVERGKEARLDLRARAKFMRLGDLLPIAMLFLPQDHPKVALLSKLGPQSEVWDFDLRLHEPVAEQYEWQAAGRFYNLNTLPSGKIPGVSGLNLAFNVNAEGGRVNLAADDFRLQFETLFREPLHADLLSGQIDWQVSADEGLNLASRGLTLANSDIKTITRIDLQIPFDKRPPVIDLQSDFEEGDARSVSRYLPTGIMHENLVAWLDRAFVDGRVTKGSMLLRGPLNAFPFVANEGRFQVLFDTEAVDLNYMPEWPPVEQAQAQIHFLNNSLDIQIREAMLLQSQINRAKVAIKNLAHGSPVLIQGQIQGPASDGLKILGDTPLSKQFAPLVETVTMEGPATVDLNLAVPLVKKVPFRIKGEVAWSDVVVNLPAWDLSLTKVNGRLGFSEKGVSAKAIKAEVLGANASIDVSTEGKETVLRATLPINSEPLVKKLPGIYLEQLRGRSDSDLEIRIGQQDKGRTPLTFSVESDLKGMTVDAPPPFAKAADEKRHFVMRGDLSDPKAIQLAIDYGEGLDAKLLVDSKKKRLLKAALQTGPTVATLPKESIIQLSGVIDRVDWGLWYGWLQGLAKEGKEGQPLPLVMALDIGELQWLGQNWRQVNLQGRDDANLLKLQFSGQNLQGQLQLYADEAFQRQNSVELKQLNLNFDFDASMVNQEKPPITPTDDDPHDFPPMRVSVEQFSVNDKPLGSLSFALLTQPDGITLQGFRLEGEQLNLSGDGGWSLTGGQHTTRLDLFLSCTNLGQLLDDLGFASNIHSTDLASTLRLNWSLPVTQLRAEELNGHVEVLASNGRFRTVDPGIGRLIGLLSISEIGRRLTLDFSDLFGDGFAFNNIAGSLQIEKGDAFTKNMVIDGPSAKIELVGRSGLASHDYDQEVTVIPAVSAGIPLVGMLAGGPVVGAVLLAAQKLIGGVVDKTAQSKYRLTGTWDEPIVEAVKRQQPTKSQRDAILELD